MSIRIKQMVRTGHSERWLPYLLLLPAVVLLLVFRVAPAVAGFRESLYSHNLSQTKRAFVGLDKFIHVFQDPIFWKSLRVTVVFSLVVNPLQTVLALAMALVANQRVRGIAFFRSIYLLPVVISLNITSTVWGLLLNKDLGLVNAILVGLGLPRQPFLQSSAQALWTIIGIISWVGVPYWMMFFLAGLQGIPQSLYEAAAIDGANAWQGFLRITLPLLRRVFAFVLISDTVVNLFLFAPIWILTRGGPELSTNLLMYDAYRRGFVWGDLASSAVMMMVLLVIAAVAVAAEFFVLGAGAD
jgi:ABC-type sugar transport system permease subunit